MSSPIPAHSPAPLSVRVIMGSAPGDFARLTPGGNLRWGNCQFEFNPAHAGTADFAVVFYNARACDRFVCAPANTLFIAGEPPAKKTYPVKYYRQFYHVVDTHNQTGHPRVKESALGLPWHVGLDLQTNSYRYGYDYLSELPSLEKSNRISVVCSDAAHTEGQRRRLAFLRALKAKLGDQLIHYGRGFEPIRDKLEAIAPHRFHLVLENSESPHYWTEKLTDAYLGWAFPFYVGCPNLSDYFSADAFVRLDMNAVDAAVQQIRGRLATPMTAAEREAIAQARLRVLNEYNPFAWAARWVEKFYQAAPAGNLIVRSHKAFRPFPRGWLFRWRGR
jgi:hypothetical protein